MKSCSGRKCNTLVPYVEGKTYNAKLMHGGARYVPILMNRACVGSSSLPCRSDTSTTLSTTESTQRAEMRTDMKRVALKQNRLRHNPRRIHMTGRRAVLTPSASSGGVNDTIQGQLPRSTH